MKKSVDFSVLAPIYDLLGSVVFMGALHKSQVELIQHIPNSEKVLILGGGTGKFLVDLLKANSFKSVTYVDVSPGMISKAKKKLKRLDTGTEVNFICGGLEDIPVEKYDLICTHYFLDCFEEGALSSVMLHLKSYMKADGKWHFSDFYLDETSSFLRKRFVSFLYWFFRISCGLKVRSLADFTKAFKEINFKLEREKYFKKGLLRTAIYSSKSC